MTIPLRACAPLAVVGVTGALAAAAATPFAGISADDLLFGAGVGLPLLATGLLAWRKRPDLPISRLLLAVGCVMAGQLGLSTVLEAVHERAGVVPALWPAAALADLADASWLVLGAAAVALFPDGVAARRSERAAVRAFWLVAAAVPLRLLTDPTVAVVPDAPSRAQELANPLRIDALAGLDGALRTLAHLNGVPFAIAIVLLFLRYRRADAIQRLQIRWLLFVAAATVVLAESLWAMPGKAFDVAGVAVAYLGMLLLPVAVLVAILRYRLLEVDVLIRRSLVYGVLWLAIVAAYVGAAAALGIAASGQLPVSAAILLTIVATLGFQPARRRLEALADRWVFGERLGGYELLTRFGATLEETFDPDELFSRLADSVRRGLRVRWARVLVRHPAGEAYVLEPQAAAGVRADAAVEAAATVPLVHAGEALGLIEVGPKESGDVTDEDRALLQTLARQAAIAIRNAHLAAELSARLQEIRDQATELRASRRRIVHAQDAERRRIERNIHDGVQQQLVALMAKLRLARNEAARDGAPMDRTLAELQDDARHVLQDLRELAQGIHPSVLSDRGLVDAIEARIARLPLPVTMRADAATRSARFEAEAEAAAYFVASEALTNALKHAGAHRVEMEIAHAGGQLTVAVDDDGRGFDPAGASGVGLRNMADRVEALGGRLSVRAGPGEGARISARIPATVREAVHA